MKRPLAAVLMAVGAALILWGGYTALSALAGFYQANLSDPMNQPEGSERAVSARMLRGAAIGAVGVPFSLVGATMWWVGKRRRRP